MSNYTEITIASAEGSASAAISSSPTHIVVPEGFPGIVRARVSVDGGTTYAPVSAASLELYDLGPGCYPVDLPAGITIDLRHVQRPGHSGDPSGYPVQVVHA